MAYVLSLLVRLAFDLFVIKFLMRDPHDRMHPRYGLPRERVRAMKRTPQGRAELRRIDDHPEGALADLRAQR